MNTDKYEGHTPGPWRFGSDLNVYDHKGNTVVHVDDLLSGEHDAKLMAAAPDLLAEVKRLRRREQTLEKLVSELKTTINQHKEAYE